MVGHHTGGVIAVVLAASFSSRVRSLMLSSTPFTGAAFHQARAGSAPIDEVAPTADGVVPLPDQLPDACARAVLDFVGGLD